jgi:hypothetical protein
LLFFFKNGTTALIPNTYEQPRLELLIKLVFAASSSLSQGSLHNKSHIAPERGGSVKRLIFIISAILSISGDKPP